MMIKKIIRAMLEWNTKRVIIPIYSGVPDNDPDYIQIDAPDEQVFAE